MSEPTDAELLAFIARFAGRPKVRLQSYLSAIETGQMPDYLNDLNAWNAEVWPKIIGVSALALKWWIAMTFIIPNGTLADCANATARQKCLALFHALDGKLPQETTDNAL